MCVCVHGHWVLQDNATTSTSYSSLLLLLLMMMMMWLLHRHGHGHGQLVHNGSCCSRCTNNATRTRRGASDRGVIRGRVRRPRGRSLVWAVHERVERSGHPPCSRKRGSSGCAALVGRSSEREKIQRQKRVVRLQEEWVLLGLSSPFVDKLFLSHYGLFLFFLQI